MDGRLNIAFVWHMHQPVYKDPFTGRYVQPWVLLHGTKDYLDMAAILDEFPEIRQTFNMAPSLVEQIEDYAAGRASDYARDLTLKDPAALTRAEKKTLLEKFFQANWHWMIRPRGRYWDLLEKRGFSGSGADVETAVRIFTDQEILDLQVLFNLVWIDPQFIRLDPELSSLSAKGAYFSSDDKELVVRKQTEIMGRILPKYRELMRRGAIEVSASPYFHPILPLLCDSESAREAVPDIMLPARRFVHPEDAAVQIRLAVEAHERVFGERPKGMWPSEGSVSMEAVRLISEAGIKWIASDEEILGLSIGKHVGRDGHGNVHDPFLYRPYSIDTNGSRLNMVFRDHYLSDLIGFEYARMDPEAAAWDLIRRLEHVRNAVHDPESHVVSIILDGENAWETYQNDGRDFLCSLYTKLSESKTLKCTTVGKFLDCTEKKEPIRRIFAGSWINHNFRIWIGHVEDNTAWGLITSARDALVAAQEKAGEGTAVATAAGRFLEAWRVLYAAEGSDWFWWYGDDHSSANDAVFDSLFRLYIKKVYALIGVEPPMALDIPIISRERGLRPERRPTRYMAPVLDGELTNYFEWLPAGSIERTLGGPVSGAMHTDMRWEGLIGGIEYGFDTETLYLKFEYLDELKGYERKWRFTINVLHPRTMKLEAHVEGNVSFASFFARRHGENGGWADLNVKAPIASDRVVEVALPHRLTSAAAGDELWIFIEIDGCERGYERWPGKGYVIIDIPKENFGEDDWSV
jgi:alpha-amylase/alpha-mannosidase (GH57 family)